MARPSESSSDAGGSGALAAFRRRWNADTDTEAITAACASVIGDAGRIAAVDPVSVAARYGAKVNYRTWEDRLDREHGALAVRDRRWQIDIPANLKAERRRFSVAHEIGHILLLDAVAEEPDLVRELTDPRLRTRIERLCNLAAANLLMPAAATRTLLDERPELDAEALPALAEHFYVSYEAMARRIAELDRRRTLIIWDWNSNHPRGAAWRTSKGQDRSGAKFIPDGMSSKRLSPDLITRAAEAGFASADVVRFDSRITTTMFDARAWRNKRSSAVTLTSDDQPAHLPEKVFLLARLQ